MARRSALKVWYTGLRNLPDRMAHRRRHESVCRYLAAMPCPTKVLVICAGNVCRSPYLEALLQRALPDVKVASAGLVGSGRPVASDALTTAARRGIDLSAKRSNMFQPHRARSADLVLVMDVEQANYIHMYGGVPYNKIVIAGDLDPHASETRGIRDPWNQPIDVFESTFDRLERCAAVLVDLVLNREPAAVATVPHGEGSAAPN